MRPIIYNVSYWNPEFLRGVFVNIFSDLRVNTSGVKCYESRI